LKQLCLIVFLVLLGPLPGAAAAAGRPLTIEDVLDTVQIDHVAVSPDGSSIAAVVQRPARPGEVYGRAPYETDPSRSDVWLISRATGERRNLTQGAAAAAGFWCAAWSPDGRRLAMLSTRPEGNEPRGGDNVHIYIWDGRTGLLSRLSSAPVMTQTRYGSPLYGLDLRGGAAGGTIPSRCGGDENAPFLWLDERRLLAVMLPEGEVSGLIDAYQRPVRHTAETAAALREGRAPTVSASGSGEARVAEAERARRAFVRTIDVATGAAATVAEVPVYPFRGALALSVAPDGRRAAVLATTGTIAAAAGEHLPYNDGAWAAERRLGFIDLAGGGAVRWATPPSEGRYPLELLSWSPDSHRVALRARGSGSAATTPLFLASASDLSVSRAGPEGVTIGTADAGVEFPHEAPLFWLDARRILARLDRGAESGWWLLSAGGSAGAPIERGEAPGGLRRSPRGTFYGLGREGGLVRLDLDRRRFVEVPGVALPKGSYLAGPSDPVRPTPHILVNDGSADYRLVPFDGGAPATFALAPRADIVALEPSRILWRDADADGLRLRETSAGAGGNRDLLTLDTHLAEVDWGDVRVIDYRSTDGAPLKAQVILPPGYREGRPYPLITWVYPRNHISGPEGYYVLKHMPGFYNLYLYAARGYVVLIPSMPLRREGTRNETYADIPGGVLPAVERLVELGIADPDRVGVLGQSFGGYAVDALVTQTRRFRAAVAIAGISDVSLLYGEFDRTARGYPGIEHEKSDNVPIIERGAWALGGPPDEDRAMYERNSPINYVDRVETPLLLIQGEYDVRGQMSQAETFFYALHRRGRTARLLRYWGEGHSLAQSPANVRNVFEETMAWFDRWLAPRQKP
jgi:dipeptidyl aminopeptidase/acylaminoacyl peptidase